MLGLSPYSWLSHKNQTNAYFYIVTDAKSAQLPAFLWWTGILLIKIEFLLIKLYIRNLKTNILLIYLQNHISVKKITKETKVDQNKF